MFDSVFHYGIPSYITGAQFPVFGSIYDPIGPTIASYTAAAAFQSPGTWAAASAIGQEQALGWTMALQSLNSFGPTANSYLGGLSNLINWAGSGFLW